MENPGEVRWVYSWTDRHRYTRRAGRRVEANEGYLPPSALLASWESSHHSSVQRGLATGEVVEHRKKTL